jgi:hypothetical protein
MGDEKRDEIEGKIMKKSEKSGELNFEWESKRVDDKIERRKEKKRSITC